MRTVKGGAIQFVEQYLRCGAATSNPLACAKAIEKNGGVEPPPFDEGLITKWREAYQKGAEEITGRFKTLSEFKKAEFDKWYEIYLAFNEWKNKKSKVFARAEVVHHLTYKHVGEEFLFELVALCRPCHDRHHKDEEET